MSPPRRTTTQQRDPATPEVAPRAPRKPSAIVVVSNLLAEKQDSLAAVSTKYLRPERLVKLGQLAIARNPDLAKCTWTSLLDAFMECARLGLEPHVPGGIWLIPFNDNRKNVTVCTRIIDYRGMIDVARRSGAVAAVHADLLCKNDLWEYWVDAESPVLIHLRHRPAPGDRGEILGAYAVVKLANGQVQAQHLTVAEINAYKARSKTANSSMSPWKSDENAMRLKTVLRRLYNLLPKNPEMQALREALAGEVDDIDNPEGTVTSSRRVRQIVAQVAADDAAGDGHTTADEAEEALRAAGGEGEVDREEGAADGDADDGVEFETAQEEEERRRREVGEEGADAR